MNKTEYLIELRKKLKKLSEEEIENAVSYYEEYFDDAGIENEQKVIEEIGTPASVASKIIGELVFSQAEVERQKGKEKNKIKGITTGMIIAAIFASPIALPIALAFVVVIMALVISVGAIYFSFMVTGIALAGSGLLTFGLSFMLIVPSLPNAVMMLGAGVFLIAVGVAACIGTINLSKVTFLGIKKLLAKFLMKGAKQ